MRLVIQRVSEASVKVGKENVVGKIDLGLLILIGIKEGDDRKDAEVLAEKVSKLRVMQDSDGKMNLSVAEVKGKVLAVSQFTLYADTSKGNRPSFVKAAEPKIAKDLYDYFVEELRKKGVEVETGSFGEYMKISAGLDGPVTIIIDSDR